MTAYYVHKNGTASSYAQATGVIGAVVGTYMAAANPALCMNLNTLNAAGDVFSSNDVIYFTSQGGDFTEHDTLHSIDAQVHLLSSGILGKPLKIKSIEGETPHFEAPNGVISFFVTGGIDYLSVEGTFSIKTNGAKGIMVGNLSSDTSGAADSGYTVTFDGFNIEGQGANDADGCTVNGESKALFKNIKGKNIRGTSSQILSTHNNGKLRCDGLIAENCEEVATAITTSSIEIWNFTAKDIYTNGFRAENTASVIFHSGVVTLDKDNTVGAYAKDAGSTVKWYDIAWKIEGSSTAVLYWLANQQAIVHGENSVYNITAGGENINLGQLTLYGGIWNVDSSTFFLHHKGGKTHITGRPIFNMTSHRDRFIQTLYNSTNEHGEFWFESAFVTGEATGRFIDIQDNVQEAANDPGEAKNDRICGCEFVRYAGICYRLANRGVIHANNNLLYLCTNDTPIVEHTSADTGCEQVENLYIGCTGTDGPIDKNGSGIVDRNLYFGNTKTGTDYGDTDPLLVDPDFVDATNDDFRPQHESVIRSGSRWWKGFVNPLGRDQPLPDILPPKGPNQEPGYGPYHPLNLKKKIVA